MNIYDTVQELRKKGMDENSIILILCERYNRAMDFIEILLSKELPQPLEKTNDSNK